VAEGVSGVGISVRADDPDLRDLPGNLDWAERLGVDSVELPTLAMDLVAGGRILRERVRRLKSTIEGRPFRYSVHGPIGINLMDRTWRLPLHEEVLAASIEIAAELGAEHYVVHSGMTGVVPGPVVEEAFARQREALNRAGDQARSLGVIVCVENVFSNDIKDTTALPSRLAQEIEAIGHPNVKACLDFSHGFIWSTRHSADYLAEAAALAPFAKHLHVHDSFGRPAEIETFSRAEKLAFGQGDLHLPVGWGAIPWDALIERLRFHPGVVFNIELDQRYRSEGAETVKAVRALARRAKVARVA
jgi:sugar phosphate isomerase/epimerase